MLTKGEARLWPEITVDFSYLDFRVAALVDHRRSTGAAEFETRMQYRFGERAWSSAGVPVAGHGFQFVGSLFRAGDVLQVKFDLVVTRLDGAVTAPVTLAHEDSGVIDVAFPY